MKSRFSIKNVYTPLIAALLVFTGGFYLGMHPEIKFKTDHGGMDSTQVPALAFTFAGILWTALIVRKARRVTIGTNIIVLQSLFVKKAIDKNDISSINLLARSDGDLASTNDRVSGMLIMLHNFNKVFIPERYYNNFGEIKNALRANFGSFISPGEKLKSTSGFSKNSCSEKFAGNALFTLNTFYIIVFSVVLFSVPLLVKPATGYNGVTFIFLSLPIAFFLLAGIQMNYFIVMDAHLVIKNHFWLWRSIVYNINDIEQVVAEKNIRTSNNLRISFKTNKTKSYGAGSLREKTWRALISKLTSMGVEAVCEV